MLPVLFKIGPLTIHTYGVAMAIAFLVAVILIRSEAKRKGFNPDIAYDIVLFAMIGGILGARIVYVIDFWSEFASNVAQIFAIWQGGLVFYGGLIGGALAVVGYVKLRKLPVGKIADMVAPSLALGSAIGRLGCFANGCCYGKETTLPWGVTFNNAESFARPLGIPLQPTQLYEFAYNIVTLGVLLWLRPRIKSDGMLFWVFITLYGLFRFIVEFFRANPAFLLGMSASQAFSIVMFISGITVIFGYYLRQGQLEIKRANK
ncbi:MAG TPA: prolipoprotein diacylglyceryl transferase [Candidatus Aquicultor sp.]